MAGVAQLVRALVCGTKGRGFESRRLPQLHSILNGYNFLRSSFDIYIF